MEKEQGLVLVFTGNGKGKTTAALGLAMRSWGHQMKILILQFIKGRQCGEHLAAQRMKPGLEIRPLGMGFIQFHDPEDMKRQRIAASEAMKEVESTMLSGQYHLLILDEILYAIKYGLIELGDVLSLLDNKPGSLHLVLTGRDVPPEIVERADLVTEMREIKHPFKQGIPAQKGIEF
ncbi:cob(I)yrinic acid a,c-diamide adenosyltransferase [Desulforamulus reducens MI-1]|uniref:Cob(I)yrinic acid a,c-diamide adenosyltransferase n=1 Tax=Desulforamulus reducens (strain ATCC BAA-1160 / DSM 100696 / MI-1) TaxID=349161 RepID=A4J0L4_DESRM|nr:cob(I)yrinic acid a,c-diamide adenosyltransferase [Desulforamulus reducens]ABO48617.1 cob(I)yrinic acid a,c-diamide adenosyltransferase [Desulforamulus reducens MI-1]